MNRAELRKVLCETLNNYRLGFVTYEYLSSVVNVINSVLLLCVSSEWEVLDDIDLVAYVQSQATTLRNGDGL